MVVVVVVGLGLLFSREGGGWASLKVFGPGLLWASLKVFGPGLLTFQLCSFKIMVLYLKNCSKGEICTWTTALFVIANPGTIEMSGGIEMSNTSTQSKGRCINTPAVGWVYKKGA